MKIRPGFRYCKRLALLAFFVVQSMSCASPSASGVAAQVVDAALDTITLPISTRFTVAVADPLHSSTARVGQEFGVVLSEPLVDAWGTIAAPAGTPATGRVLNVEKAGLVVREARLLITIRAIRVGDQTYPIRTNSMNIEGGREGWITPLSAEIRTGRTFLFTLVAPVTLPIDP